MKQIKYGVSAAILLVSGMTSTSILADAADDVAGVVQTFNAAVTARQLDQLLNHFAEGGVQFTIRPSHEGLKRAGLTEELATRWSMVGPVLFSATKAYTRKAEILDARAIGDLATVWARIDTETVSLQGKATTETFSEVYLLVRSGQDWKIAGIADNRQPDNIGLGTTQE
jgi:ketosteroid isomerase-like protein